MWHMDYIEISYTIVKEYVIKEYWDNSSSDISLSQYP